MTNRFDEHNKINVIDDIESHLMTTLETITLGDIIELFTFIVKNPNKFKNITENEKLMKIIDSTKNMSMANVDSSMFTIDVDDADLEIFISTIINVKTWNSGILCDNFANEKLLDFLSALNSVYDVDEATSKIIKKMYEFKNLCEIQGDISLISWLFTGFFKISMYVTIIIFIFSFAKKTLNTECIC